MIPSTIVNYAAFIDGRGYAGRIDVQLPELTLKTEDYDSGGLAAGVRIAMGRVEPVDVGFTLKEYNPEVLKLFGLANGRGLPLVVRGAQRGDDGVVHEVRVDVRGLYYQTNLGSFDGDSRAEMEGTINARWYRLAIDGETIHELDAENCKLIIGGVDQLEEVRRAIGI
ncbi:phage major tail tube protein [Thioalkalivibrio sulfidiphilus]|uniref:phage major tail tube protein n=1 Tax=Thioalkalivibrio sulfidiphilus TaxID=1033854 RepID=UPI003B33A286